VGIAGANVVTGTKAATTGTAFTIALSPAANTFTVVGVAIPGGAVTVSTVTEGAHVYHRVSQVVLADLVLEVWATDEVKSATSGGTITVTLSATGTLAAGIARNFTGVSFAGTVPSTSNGTTSPSAPGTISSQGDNLAGNLSEWSAVIALNVNAAMTQNQGILRGQVAVTGAAIGFVDQNHSTPTTMSVTFADTEWIAIWFEQRTLSPLADSMTLTDAETQVFSIADSVVETLVYQVNAS